ncbi:MAG: RNA 2',3'-cyclic phosphodiesterase [Sneathiella sp.]
MRLFVALPLPEDIKQRIETLRGGIPDARWIPPGNAHLTLAFLGDVPDIEIADIGLALGQIDYPAFDLQIETVGVFGNTKRPRILWAGVKLNDDLIRLQQKVAIALNTAGYQIQDRRFKPHITLARVHMSPYEKIRQYLSDNALFKCPPIPVTEFTLFSSHLAHSGAIYTEEMMFDLEPVSERSPLSSHPHNAPVI